MKDITVDYERLEIDRLNLKVRDSSKKSAEKLRRLQEALKIGNERSDDKIKDFVTVYFGMWDDETTEPFRSLQKKVQENQGNEILVIKKAQEKKGLLVSYLSHQSHQDIEGMMPEPDFYTAHLDLNLGRISSPLELNIQTSEIVVPVANHLSASLEYADFGGEHLFPEDSRWEVCEGPIKKKLEDLPHLLSKKIKLVLERYRLDYSGKVESFIFSGAEVKDYFSKHCGGEKFYGKIQQTILEHAKNKVDGL